ncbi:MAG: hypothetical protein ACOY40_09730 [Bacillota bacterium]
MIVLNVSRHSFFIVFAVFLIALVPPVYKIILAKHNKTVPEPGEIKEKPSPYGEFLAWEEANRVFPKYARATIIELETGLQFRVQRRAGRYHADVQPLTAGDTAVMKMIYNGKWSWKRKAIIVQLDNGRRIAASMNGMPHGGGAIRGNNFDGHFCIHFRDSKTHTGGEVNTAHQIMVWKAAGRVDEQLVSLPPRRVIDVFFTALDQGEASIAGKAVDAGSVYSALLPEGFLEINSVRVDKVVKGNDKNSFNVSVWVVYRGSDRECKKNMLITMINIENKGWKIEPQSLLPLLNREAWVEIRPWYDKQYEKDYYYCSCAA